MRQGIAGMMGMGIMGLRQQRGDATGIPPRQLVAHQLCLMQFIMAGLVQRQQGIFQGGVEGQIMFGEQPGLRLAQIGEDSIDAVQAGSGH